MMISAVLMALLPLLRSNPVLSTAPGSPIVKPSPLSCLIVGGGPNRENNGATIEAHVRFVSSILPRDTYRRVLFADGSKKNLTVKVRRNVSFAGKEATAPTIFADVLADALNSEADQPLHTPGMQVLTQMGKSLTMDVDDLTLYESIFRTPKLPAINGKADRTSVVAEFNGLASRPPSPVLIYFAGHGEGGAQDDRQNTIYDLWAGDMPANRLPSSTENTLAELADHQHMAMPDMGGNPRLTVRDLAAALAPIPTDRPITFVMVQCYGGGFGNLLFEKGDATGAISDRPLCGFFATPFDRLAAGCGVESRLSNQDFTATFFAALYGKDAEGKNVTANDFDGDGKISLYEAYLYSLVNDSSIDIPVATSDILLRRLVHITDAELVALNDSKIQSIAEENDRAASGHRTQVEILERLRARIRELSAGDETASQDVLSVAWDEVKPRSAPAGSRPRFGNRSGGGVPDTPAKLLASFQTIAPNIQNDEQIKPLVKKHPTLTPDEKVQISRVLIPKIEPAIREGTKRNEEAQLRVAYLRRYWEFAKTIFLQKRLRDTGTPEDLARMDHLRERESANPLRK